MSNSYFALDGSYGDATEILIVDTDDWTPEEWELINYATDDERSDMAQQIIDKYRYAGKRR